MIQPGTMQLRVSGMGSEASDSELRSIAAGITTSRAAKTLGSSGLSLLCPRGERPAIFLPCPRRTALGIFFPAAAIPNLFFFSVLGYNASMAGKFIVIEGTDGSGKGEQTIRLVKRIKDSGKEIAPFDFPRYSEPSAWFVSQYLNGAFGTIEQVGPKTASLFYALDRYAAAPAIRAALDAGSVVVSNRYVASNLGHQGSKYDDRDERQKYFEWNYDLEYAVNGIPKPDLNIILHIPAEIAQSLVDKKIERQYLTGKKRDLHETDINHLKKTEEVYKQLAGLFPKDFTIIECVENGNLLSIEEVHEKVWAIARNVLGL